MQYWAYVQRPDSQIFRQSVLAYQQKKTVMGGTEIPESVVMVNPDANGVMSVDENHVHYGAIKTALENKMKRDNRPGEAKRLVGPFGVYNDALVAAIEERPKTPSEMVASMKAENDALKARLAQLNLNRSNQSKGV